MGGGGWSVAIHFPFMKKQKHGKVFNCESFFQLCPRAFCDVHCTNNDVIFQPLAFRWKRSRHRIVGIIVKPHEPRTSCLSRAGLRLMFERFVSQGDYTLEVLRWTGAVGGYHFLLAFDRGFGSQHDQNRQPEPSAPGKRQEHDSDKKEGQPAMLILDDKQVLVQWQQQWWIRFAESKISLPGYGWVGAVYYCAYVRKAYGGTVHT